MFRYLQRGEQEITFGLIKKKPFKQIVNEFNWSTHQNYLRPYLRLSPEADNARNF